MMKCMATFRQKCLQGEAVIEQLDDYIDDWHKSSSPVSLADFLGFTDDEYALWLSKPGVLAQIVADAR